ncbi:MAG: hypothetical protein HKM86_12615 [Deltaproteobacteria bacterium]|nr:hypothetical protein [Deltaproteobacteria bacterium]
MASFRKKFQKGEMRFSPEAMETLTGHDWGGNIRELENLIERCVLLGGEGEVSRDQLVSIWEGGVAGEKGTDRSPRVIIRVPVSVVDPDLKNAVKEMERQMIRLALERTGGSRPKAAELLGISHPALLYKAKEYGIN